MSKAMNRSFAQRAVRRVRRRPTARRGKTAAGLDRARRSRVEDAAIQLAYAQLVIVVPGYGMAVAQAQHQVRELAELIEKRGGEVKYAIHPVAGRMPGHMNVLLAEANVPYDQLYDMDEINGEFAQADVALVIGANDVVNPGGAQRPASARSTACRSSTRTRPSSVIVLKRSMNAGLRRHRERAVLRREDVHALRRRQELAHQAGDRGEERLMALSTTQKFSFGLLCVTALAVLFAGVAYLNINEVSARSGWVAHTSRVLLSLEDIGSSLTAAESGQRGYLVSGKSEYLEPYFAVRERVSSEIADLRRLIADNPRQRARIDSLERVISKRLSISQESIDSARQRSLEAGRAVASSGRGKSMMDSAFRLLDAMTDEERGLLDSRLRQQRSGVERSRTIVTAGLGLTVLLCAIGAVTIITDHDARTKPSPKSSGSGMRRSSRPPEPMVKRREPMRSGSGQKTRRSRPATWRRRPSSRRRRRPTPWRSWLGASARSGSSSRTRRSAFTGPDQTAE